MSQDQLHCGCDRMRPRQLAIVITLTTFVAALSQSACRSGSQAGARSAPSASIGRCAAVAPPRPFLLRSDSIVPLDDTAQVMRALGQQLQLDYRCAPLLFSASVVCANPSVACDSGRRGIRPSLPQNLPRFVTLAMHASGGVPCVASSCPADSTTFLFELSAPLVYGDTAEVTVMVYPPPVIPGAMHFEHYTYRMTRWSPFAWLPRARVLESIGEYGRQ